MAVLAIDSPQGCCQYTQTYVTQRVMTHLETAESLDHEHILAEKKPQYKIS
jgi:hypothetical protein